MHLRQNLTPRQNQCNRIGIQTDARQINKECLNSKWWEEGIDSQLVAFFLQTETRSECRELEPLVLEYSMAEQVHAWQTGSGMTAKISLQH